MSFDQDTLIELKSNTLKEKLNCTKAKALVNCLHKSQNIAQGNMTRSQQRYAAQANKHCRVVDFGVRDKVQVIIKHQNNDRPSYKLAQQMDRLYEVLKQIGHSFRLKLLESIKVYLVFYAKKLCKDPNNPLLGQTNPKSKLIKV